MGTPKPVAISAGPHWAAGGHLRLMAAWRGYGLWSQGLGRPGFEFRILFDELQDLAEFPNLSEPLPSECKQLLVLVPLKIAVKIV